MEVVTIYKMNIASGQNNHVINLCSDVQEERGQRVDLGLERGEGEGGETSPKSWRNNWLVRSLQESSKYLQASSTAVEFFTI